MNTQRGLMRSWFFAAFCVIEVLVSHAQDSACLNQLVPCLAYISSDKTPPSSCCTPLKSLISSDPQYLCSMLGRSSAARQTRVNMTQVQLLPARCGERVNTASCKSGTMKTSTRTKTAVSNSSGQLPSEHGIVVALFSLTAQAIWMAFG